MPKILPIILSRISQKIHSLFFFYSCMLPIIPIVMFILVYVAKRFHCSVRVIERSIRVYRSIRGVSALSIASTQVIMPEIYKIMPVTILLFRNYSHKI